MMFLPCGGSDCYSAVFHRILSLQQRLTLLKGQAAWPDMQCGCSGGLMQAGNTGDSLL